MVGDGVLFLQEKIETPTINQQCSVFQILLGHVD